MAEGSVDGIADMDATELDAVAREIDEATAEAEVTVQLVRQVAGARRRGESWKAITSAGDVPKASVSALMSAARRLGASASQLRRVFVRGVAREGGSTRNIGRIFAISHQRVSAILSRKP